MARIKAEVREHAHQQRRARQHHPANAAPSYAPPAPAPAPVVVKTEVGVSLLPPQDPPVVAPAGGRCIDLTADEETEDEEDTDEPFATDLQRIRNQEHEQEHKDEQDDGEASPMELETDAEDEEVSKATAPRAAMAHDATDESDVDEEMPTPQVRSADEGADPVSKDASPRVGVSGGVRAVVDKIGHALLNAVMPSLPRSGAPAPSAVVENELEAETPMAQGAKGDAVSVGGEDAENDEEEEDERWPELQSREAEREDDVGDDDRDSTGSETAESSVEARQATVGSLEDGEILEEGAVVKSPTAVKEAIAQELEAARAAAQAAIAKKKQKKRGRKKNKRKVEVMLTAAPVDEVDEFGRNVRYQPMIPRPVSVVQSSHMQPFLPSIAMSLPTQTSVHAPPPLLPLPPLMTTPPHPPPVPQPSQLPVPMHDYGKPHAPQQFLDDQIVRVNRHGGFEPFALHGNSRGPRPPIAPPFSQPSPLAPPTGFRYVSMDHFRPEGTGAVGEGSPNRGLKRPHQPSKQGVDDEPAFDLDSLRAAALKTKRKLAKESHTAAPIDPPMVTAAAPDPSADTSSATDGAAEEGEGDLDALRMELLKSMRRRRREPSGQSTSSVTESVDDASSGKSSGSSRVEPEPSPINTPTETAGGKPTATASLPLVMETRKQEHAVETRLSSSTLPELASPPLRPLTAVSQSCVIRFSLDDLSLDEQKSRANSFDDAAARYEKVVQDVRAKAVSAKLTDAAQRTEPHGPAALASKATTTTEEQSFVVAARTGASTTRTADTSVDAAEPTAQESTARAEAEANGVDKTEKVVPTTTRTVVVDPEVLADPVRLEAERQACLANIREADANIARLDAEIAALRHALAAREADSQSSVTACGA